MRLLIPAKYPRIKRNHLDFTCLTPVGMAGVQFAVETNWKYIENGGEKLPTRIGLKQPDFARSRQIRAERIGTAAHNQNKPFLFTES